MPPLPDPCSFPAPHMGASGWGEAGPQHPGLRLQGLAAGSEPPHQLLPSGSSATPAKFLQSCLIRQVLSARPWVWFSARLLGILTGGKREARPGAQLSSGHVPALPHEPTGSEPSLHPSQPQFLDLSKRHLQRWLGAERSCIHPPQEPRRESTVVLGPL